MPTGPVLQLALPYIILFDINVCKERERGAKGVFLESNLQSLLNTADKVQLQSILQKTAFFNRRASIQFTNVAP